MPGTTLMKEEWSMRKLAAAVVLGAVLMSAAAVHAEEMQFTVVNL